MPGPQFLHWQKILKGYSPNTLSPSPTPTSDKTVRTGSWSMVTSQCFEGPQEKQRHINKLCVLKKYVIMLACFALTESLETTALPCTKAAGGVMRSPHDEHPHPKNLQDQHLLKGWRVHSTVSDSATPWTVAHQAPLSRNLQARIVEWVAKPSSRGSSRPRD